MFQKDGMAIPLTIPELMEKLHTNRRYFSTSAGHDDAYSLLLLDTIMFFCQWLSSKLSSSSIAEAILLWISWLINKISFVLKLKMVVWYLACETGNITLSIIEPAHSIHATNVYLHLLMFKKFCRSSFHELFIWSFSKIRVRRNAVAKAAKLTLVAFPFLREMYETYIKLRFIRTSIANTGNNLFHLNSIMSILFWYIVYMSGGLHTKMAMFMLYCTIVHFTGMILIALTYGLWTNLMTSIGNWSLFRRYMWIRIICIPVYVLLGITLWFFPNVPEAFWNDSKCLWELQANIFSQTQDDYIGMMSVQTDSAIFNITSQALDVFISFLPNFFQRPFHLDKDRTYYSTQPIALISPSRVMSFAIGARDLLGRYEQVNNEGNDMCFIEQVASQYSAIDERVEAVVEYFLMLRPGGVVSYRHEETFGQSCEKIQAMLYNTGVEVVWADVFCREIRKEEDLNINWFRLGLEPYMYFNLLRENEIEDGEDRLWLSLEKRLCMYTGVNVAGTVQYPPSLMNWVYFISGKIFFMLAFRYADMLESATVGKLVHSKMYKKNSFPELNLVRYAMSTYDVLEIEEGKLQSDGRLLAMQVITQEHLERARGIMNKMSEEESGSNLVIPGEPPNDIVENDKVFVQFSDSGFVVHSSMLEVIYTTDDSIDISTRLHYPSPSLGTVFSGSIPFAQVGSRFI